MKKILLLGIDGFDPGLVEKFFKQKQLPNLEKLTKIGHYSKLETANPAQSPVVWASMATGVNPGEHGLYDFITRDPHSYLPQLAIVRSNNKNILGLRSKLYSPVFSGEPFWRWTSKAGIPTSVLKWPVTFPPVKVRGKMLSGLGVCDIRNNLGQYTVISTRRNSSPDVKGRFMNIPDLNQIHTKISGPNDSMSELIIEKKSSEVHIKVEQKKLILKKGRWSPWAAIKCKQAWGREFVGMGKFLLLENEEELTIYVTALHMHPENSLAPISYPDEYAKTLAQEIGLYHTLGMPEETNGLQDEILSRDDFLKFVDNIQKERENMFWHEFNKFQKGILAFVFDTLDRIQHMLWFTQDDKHPIYKRKEAEAFQHVLTDYYKLMDKLIGKVIKQLEKDTLLMIVSDHGFSTYRRSIHLNSWLAKSGLLKLKGGNIGEPLFANVDWEKTEAYSVGFSSIFINTKGREAGGIVAREDVRNIAKHIAAELVKETDNNNPVFKAIYNKWDIYSGIHVEDAPELIVGTMPGYRISWQTALGAAPEIFIEDNIHQWCGDHLIDPSFVPGVLFCNKKLQKKNSTVYDIAPTVLSSFGMRVPNEMEGKSLL